MRAHRTCPSLLVSMALLLSVVAMPLSVVAMPPGAVASTGRAEPVGTPPAATSLPPGSARPPVHTVTLVTGDRVQVLGVGRRAHVTITASAAGTSAYSVVRDKAGLYVIPDQALPLIARQRLDERLFDVTGLISQGYDDARRNTLPVIVEYASGPAARASSPSGAHATQSLPGLDATALSVAKSEASAFWADLTAGHARRLESGVTTLWLDAKIHASLDRSAGQVGAPAAWDRGLDGSGVTVAVLDTGIDPAHPDLADRVVADANFTEEPDTDDYVGHGTHVASIVAGTGAGSDGRYRGIAPAAQLLNGKVLQLAYTGPGVPTGVGQESWILGGMLWAVDQDADIVNMSLGNAFGDGNDPLSRAVDTLTVETDTLFVVAAGNSGPGHYSVSGPGSADLALTVGSVNRDGSMSLFSSRGPRMIDGRVKPDVTAPGQDIVAARAANGKIGRPAGELYTGLSGTSMATPHVAGAAALLLQQRPDWGAADLRAALTSTAAFDPGVTVYDQGGGLIDVDRATRQDVFVDAGVLSFDYISSSQPPSDQHESRTVTYRNTANTPVTLELAAEIEHQSGEPAVDGTLTVSPASLTIEPNGSAQARIDVDAANNPPGAYSGRVVATGPADVMIETPVGFLKQGTETQLTLRALDRRGDPAPAFIVIRSPRAPNSFLVVAVPEGGSSTVRLDPGDYSYLGYIPTPDASGRHHGHLTVVADPELEATQPNRTLTLDARRAQPLGVRVPKDVDVNGLSVGLQVERPELGDFMLEDTMVFAQGASNGTIPAVPMSVLAFDRPRRGHGNLDSYWSLVSPRARAAAIKPHRYALPVALMDGSARIESRRELSLVDVGSGTPDSYAGKQVAGESVLVRETEGLSFTEQAATAHEHDAAAVLVSAASPGVFIGDAYADIPVLATSKSTGDRLRQDLARRPVRISMWGTSAATYLYDLVFRERDRLRSSTIYRPRDLAKIDVDFHATEVVDDPQRFWGLRFPAWGDVCGYCGRVAREGEDFHGDRTRVDYLTTGVRWSDYLLQDAWLQWHGTREYPYGWSETSWGRTPVVPGVPIQAGSRSERVGDQLRIRLAGYTDGDPAHVVDLWTGWFRGTTSLSRAGEPLGPCVDLYVLTCDVDVPADRATYTLTADLPAPTFTKSVQSSLTTWTFSSAPGEQVLPLIDLDYDLPVSLSNTLRADRTTWMRLGVHRQPDSAGGPIRSVRVEASFDGGTSWRQVQVVKVGASRYLTRIRQPELADSDGYGSLRVTATDAAGNSIAQEVRQAYALVP